MAALWYDQITNIRAQYEELEGSSDTVEGARIFFQQLRLDSPLVEYVNNMLRWCYTMHKWLYPPWRPD